MLYLSYQNMRQHAIPQNILDIEFKLFSKFTIREFVYIAAGVGVGSIFLFLFSGGSLPGVIAIPIFLMFAILGLFFGLASINDQKADVYVMNFFKAITNPTQRVWKNKDFDEKFEEIKPTTHTSVLTQGTMDRNNLINEPIADIAIANPVKAVTAEFETAIEQEEQNRLNQIASSINITPQTSTTPLQTSSTTVIDVPTPPQQMISNTLPMQTPVLPQSVNTVVPVQNKIKLTIGKHNAAFLKTTIPNLNIVANNINLLLTDRAGNPIFKALVFLKDSSGKLMQVVVSNQNGSVITDKVYSNGNYFITIEKEGLSFPDIEFIIDGSIIEPVKIIPIA